MSMRLFHHDTFRLWFISITGALLVSALLSTSASAATCTWTGEGGNALASNPANWSGGVPPTNVADAVVLDATSSTNMTWDLTNAVASWSQTEDYNGSVTIATTYGGDFTNMVITGACTIDGGTWTHQAHTVSVPNPSETNRLRVSVGGNFTLGANAAINLDLKGYSYNSGSAYGYGPGASTRYVGSSHGGLGGAGAPWDKVYGSLTTPVDLGSGAHAVAGGGALYLTVAQTATVHGVVSARGGGGSSSSSSGGSIYMIVQQLDGTGELNASGGQQSYRASGGGGRIAVILTGSDSFGSVTMKAYGTVSNYRPYYNSAAGTIYRQSSSQNDGEGTLVVDNNDVPYDTAMTLLTTGAPNLDNFAEIILTNAGWLALNTDTEFDWVNAANLSVFGPTESALTIQNTNAVTMPSSFTLNGLRLYTFTNLAFSANLTVTNAALITKTVAPQAGLVVGGNLHVANGGTLGHWPYSEANRLIARIQGALAIDSGGSVDVTGMGYFHGQGPGAGSAANSNNKPAGSHGGLGGQADDPPPATWVTYGSALSPTNLGSSAVRLGGGAIQLDVGGTTTLNGSIVADSQAGGLAGGAGGTVYLTTGHLTGDGAITANSVSTHQYGGGGGHIAVIVTNDTSFGNVGMQAYGNGAAGKRGAAGTLYRESTSEEPGHGVLVVDNTTRVTATNVTTQLPPYSGGGTGELQNVVLIATNNCDIELLSDAQMGDLFLTGDGVTLYLKGHDLTLGAEYHDSWGASNRVVFDGGNIIWYESNLAVETLPPTGVGQTSANLRGRVVNTGGAGNPQTYLCLHASDAGTGATSAWDRVIYMGTDWGKDQEFSTNLTDLIQGNSYAYRCYVTNAGGAAWSPAYETFTCVLLPTVTNLGASPVYANTAVLRAEVTDNGAQDPTAWFHYWLTGSASTSTVPMGVQAGAFSKEVRDLLIGSNYSYNCSASNGAGVVWTETGSFTTPADNCVWVGGGDDSLAGTPANWVQGTAPTQATDSVRLDYTSSTDMRWDLTNGISGWSQNNDYTGTVTFATTYSGNPQVLHIVGDCTVENGIWTHDGSADTPLYRINVSVDGSFVLASNAQINVDSKGYGRGQGPGAGSAAVANGKPAASHGGLGGDAINPTYGLYAMPTNLGSSAYSYGGGAVALSVAGIATIDGTISARPGVVLAQGSGGSIFITSGRFGGNGSLDVSAPYNANSSGQRGGGGGRIAVILTNGADFGAVSMAAYGGQSSGPWGAAGTIYLQVAGQAQGAGTLIVDNNGLSTENHTLMPLGTTNLNALAALVITNKGALGLNVDSALDLGSGANLRTYGPSESTIAVLCTTNLGFAGSVTITDYALYLYTNLHVAGDLTVSNAELAAYNDMADGIQVDGNLTVRTGGSLSHGANGATRDYVLNITVGGNVTVEAGGQIDVDTKGYGKGQGPGSGGGGANNNQPAASHGGLGAEHPTPPATWVTYGSVTRPTDLGSGGYGTGGGAVSLQAAGTTTLDGDILARSQYVGLAGGAGGSIYLETGHLTGAGAIDASSQSYHQYGGGGGRVAVILTSGNGFGSVSMLAQGGGNLRGADGTIYRQTASQAGGCGVLYAGQTTVPYTTNTTTQLPPSFGGNLGEIESVTLFMTNNAAIELTSDCKIGDLFVLDDDATLYLKGHTLTVNTGYHSSWGDESRVVYDGGEIIWVSRGSMFLIR